MPHSPVCKTEFEKAELEREVQQVLDADMLCHVCSHPVEECVCPNGGRPDWVCPFCNCKNTRLNRYCLECGEMYGAAI